MRQDRLKDNVKCNKEFMILSFAFFHLIYIQKSNLLRRILRFTKPTSYDLYDTQKNFLHIQIQEEFRMLAIFFVLV